MDNSRITLRISAIGPRHELSFSEKIILVSWFYFEIYRGKFIFDRMSINFYGNQLTRNIDGTLWHVFDITIADAMRLIKKLRQRKYNTELIQSIGILRSKWQRKLEITVDDLLM